MLKLFHHVRDKIKERERDRRRKEKQALMKLKVDEAYRVIVSLNDAIDDLWMAFLTPPQGHLRSLIAILINGDTRFPNKFLDDFVDIFNHLCGFNTTGNEDYVKIFQGCEWNSRDDPEYEIPKSLMLDLFEDVIENLSEDLNVEETVTSEQIEANKKSKRKFMEDLAKNSALFKPVKKETHLTIAANRFKNTLKKRK